MSAPTTPGPARSTGRFWVTVLCFALLNIAAGFAYHAWDEHSRRKDLLAVTEFLPPPSLAPVALPDPFAPAPATAPAAPFTWHFNLDVASKTGPIPADQTPGKITPAVAGNWAWADARTLIFTPDSPLPAATKFTLTLAPEKIATLEGFRLTAPYTRELSTPVVALAALRQMSFDEQDHVVLELTFTQPVLASEVLQHLTLKTPDAKIISAKLYGQNAGAIVRLQTDTLPLSPAHDPYRPNQSSSPLTLTLDISPGLGCAAGPLPTTAPMSRQVSVSSAILATNLTAYTNRGAANLSLTFNNNVDVEALKPLLTIEPACNFTIPTTGQANQIAFAGDFISGTRYTLTISKPPAEKTNSLPRPTTLSAFVPDQPSTLWFDHTEGYLGSLGHRLLALHTVNVPAVRFRVVQLYDNNLVAWRNSAKNYYASSSAENFGRTVASKRFTLENIKNKTQDLQISLDTLLDKSQLTDGVYRIIATQENSAQPAPDDDSDEGRWYQSDNSTLITLSDLALSARQTHDGAVVWVTSLSTAQPVPAARVRLYSSKNQLLAEAKTDDNGLARLTALACPPGESPAIILADRNTDRGTGVAPVVGNAGVSPAASNALTWLDLTDSRLDLSGLNTAGRPYLRSGFEAFTFTDRGIYRPGETVVLRSLLRGVNFAAPDSFPLALTIHRPDGRPWKTTTLPIGVEGLVEWRINFPSDTLTGRWSATVALPGENSKTLGAATFQIEDYVPDRMKTTMTLLPVRGTGVPLAVAPTRLTLPASSLRASLQADYLFGQPAADLQTNLEVHAAPATFLAADLPGYSFGDAARAMEPLGTPLPTAKTQRIEDRKTNASGHADIDLNITALLSQSPSNSHTIPQETAESAAARELQNTDPAETPLTFLGPWDISVTADILETGGRAITTAGSIYADQLPFYLGLKPQSLTSATPAQKFNVDLALVQPDGTPSTASPALVGTLYYDRYNSSYVFDRGHYHYISTRQLEPVKNNPVQISPDHKTLTVVPPTAGNYALIVRDPQSGAWSSLAIYATAEPGSAWSDSISRENPERLDITLSSNIALFPSGNKTYVIDNGAIGIKPKIDNLPTFSPNQSIKALIKSPFPGQLLLTIETDDILLQRVIPMTENSTEVILDLPAAAWPSAYVSATVLRAVDPNIAWRTHRAFGTAAFKIDPGQHELAIKIDAPKEVRPTHTLDLSAAITNPDGSPAAGAQVALWAVDEGILSVTNYTTPNPLAYFSAKRALGVSAFDIFAQLMPEVRPEGVSLVGGDGSESTPANLGRYRSAVEAKRFVPIALVPQLVTAGPDGIARVSLNVPEFMGQFRIMAVAVKADKMGRANSPVFVRSPVMVQSSLPRFLAPGDTCDVPLTLFNNTPAAGDAVIKLNIIQSNSILLLPSAQSSQTFDHITIPANSQITLHTTLSANSAAGVAHLDVTAELNNESFHEQTELPIRPASPTITVGDFITLTPDKPLNLQLPAPMLAGTEQLDLDIMPRPNLQLPQGLDYLDHYPYGCAEQTLSTILPLVYLPDIGQQIAPGMFAADRIKDKIDVGVTRLLGMQTDEGGIAMWTGQRETWPWASVYAAHVMLQAEKAGYNIPADFKSRLLTYAHSLLQKSPDLDSDVELQSYACYVLASAGHPDRPAMSRLADIIKSRGTNGTGVSPVLRSPEDLAHSQFLLANAWFAAGRRDLALALIPKSLPAPRGARDLAGNLASPVRDQALILDTLLSIDPQNASIPALAEKLAAAGRASKWSSTQDTAFAVLALGHYFRTTKNDHPYNEATFSPGPRVGDTAPNIPLATSTNSKPLSWSGTPSATRALSASITGDPAAKGYLSWRLTGVPLTPPADSDEGLKIRRSYSSLATAPAAPSTSPALATRAPDAPPQLTTLHRGDLVEVQITIDSPTALSNVVIEDLLPAGLEIENPRLQNTQTTRHRTTPGIVVTPAPTSAPQSLSPNALDIRDDRLILMVNLPAGLSTYSYLARAVTPGTYIIPPVRGECMYDISIHSLSSGGAKLQITPEAPPTKVAAK